jgi:hypothetical protein
MNHLDTTTIDVAFDLHEVQDPEWMDACEIDDDTTKWAIVAKWEARLTAAAEARGVTVDFVPQGGPDAFEWCKKHVHSDDDSEAVAELAMMLWDDVTSPMDDPQVTPRRIP